MMSEHENGMRVGVEEAAEIIAAGRRVEGKRKVLPPRRIVWPQAVGVMAAGRCYVLLNIYIIQ